MARVRNKNQTQPFRVAQSIAGTTQPPRSIACRALLHCSFFVPRAAKMDDFKKEVIELVRDGPLLWDPKNRILVLDNYNQLDVVEETLGSSVHHTFV
ncbi:hypothetical protein ElyMa_005559700 [Elysia marginata]|uniref:Uncharacterized protein n=1 Tax=Elysia marginata TaxID=1093978 RepID=A0AAV4F1Z9_9GAST|nr:hypothetical protein ElyMa_005559700 [Elysia marginata]